MLEGRAPTDGEHGHPRTLTWVGATALAVGGSNQSLFLIGALVLAQGSAAVPLLVVGVLLSWAAAYGWTELVLMWPGRVGGIAATCSEAFKPYSPVLANLTGVCYWWGWVPTCGLTAILSASAIHQWYLPGISVNLLACLLVTAFAALNLCGLRWVTRVAIPFACVSAGLALASALIPVLAGTVDWHRAASFHLISPFHGTFGALTSAMAGLYLIGFAAPAFEAAACHVGETRDPARNVPRAMFASALLALLYFAVLPVIWLGALGSQGLAGDLTRTLGPTFAPLLGSSAKAAAIWFMVFNMFHGTLQPLAGASRTLAQLSEDGLLPRALARRSRTDVPWVATGLTAGMSIVFLLTGDPTSLIAAANFTYLIGIGMPSVAVWLLRRNQPERERPYRAPRGTIVLGVLAAGAWGVTTLLGFEQFGLPTVIIGLGFAYVGAVFYAFRVWSDRRRSGGGDGFSGSLHIKLTGAMLGVIGLDGVGYLIAVSHLPRGDARLVTVLEDIFVAVAMLTVTVGLILPGMIAHATREVADAAVRLGSGTISELTKAMHALGRGDLDRAHAQPDLRPVLVHSHDELGAMARSFNDMQDKLGTASRALDGARDGLRATSARLQSNIAQQAAIAALGQHALEGLALAQLMDRSAEAVHQVLEVDGVTILEAANGEHVTRAHAGPAGSMMMTGRAGSERLEVPIGGRDTAFGVLRVWPASSRVFTTDEIDFLRSMANVLADAIERTRSEEETRHKALHDPLTGLPNRALFADRLAVALGHSRRVHRRVGVLFLDLDNFKLLNDSRGHEAGDELLSAVAARLDDTLRPGDTVARFGGDEFVIICADLEDPAEAVTVAERLTRLLDMPFELAGREHIVSASIGIAISEGPAQRAEDLIRDADAAMYRAKELGRGRFELFDQRMRERTLARVKTHDELRHAVERDELRLVYQPIVSIHTGDVLGVEALVRWMHPERGLMSPDHFIPIAEETGLIVQVGHWVLTEAFRQMAAWRDPGAASATPTAVPSFVSVNLSARQVYEQALPGLIERLLDEHSLPPDCVHLEITESVLMEETDEPLLTLQRLKDVGVRLALDDFGTGYSSLSYVRRFPIDDLKIDRSFIGDLGESGTGDSAIVEAIINMAKGLRVNVIAEGVETHGQADTLDGLGCDMAQGWLYSRAVPPDELVRLMPSGVVTPLDRRR